MKVAIIQQNYISYDTTPLNIQLAKTNKKFVKSTLMYLDKQTGCTTAYDNMGRQCTVTPYITDTLCLGQYLNTFFLLTVGGYRPPNPRLGNIIITRDIRQVSKKKYFKINLTTACVELPCIVGTCCHTMSYDLSAFVSVGNLDRSSSMVLFKTSFVQFTISRQLTIHIRAKSTSI